MSGYIGFAWLALSVLQPVSHIDEPVLPCRPIIAPIGQQIEICSEVEVENQPE
jgi:hypothetical protein